MSSHYTDLFKGTARYYSRYRPGYPDEMIALVIERFCLDGTGRLLDLGCGTGQLLIPLAPHVETAIGMDPEPEMLAEAARVAADEGISNAVWIEGEVTLGKWDMITLPPGLYRGFEVSGETVGWFFAVLDPHPVFLSKDPYWAPQVERQAAEYGFRSDEHGKMVKPDNYEALRDAMKQRLEGLVPDVFAPR